VGVERRVRFELIFRRYEPAVRAYAIRRAGPTVADDVVADVFVVCWRRFEQMPADALPWLLGVARHVLATQRRSERRRSALRSRIVQEDAQYTDEDLPFSEDGVLRTALEQLSDTDRELLLLVAWEGLSTAEVAVALGLRPSTARVRLMRARRRLRVELARAGATEHRCVPARMEVS
jgi:RNA polymerase sigma-70 factor (ECF subfamily)